jgi:hypothetical protein
VQKELHGFLPFLPVFAAVDPHALDGDLAVDEFVVGKIDLTHGAQPDLPHNAVPANGFWDFRAHRGCVLLAGIALLSD